MFNENGALFPKKKTKKFGKKIYENLHNGAIIKIILCHLHQGIFIGNFLSNMLVVTEK
jgi:hypothetical protein